MPLGTAKFQFELLASGIVTGTGKWGFSRVHLTGRWYYDSSSKVLQLEVSGGIQDGVQSNTVEILDWSDDNTAICKYIGRKSLMQRLS